MVAAVFHSSASLPVQGAGEGRGEGTGAADSAAVTSPLTQTLAHAGPGEQEFRPQRDLSFIWLGVMPPLLGFGLLVLLWMAISMTSKGSIPTPGATFAQAVTVFSDPFYSKGPNDQGIG